MKLFKKKQRYIVVDSIKYIYVVDENSDCAELRIYTQDIKDRCCKVKVDYRFYHNINFNLPSVVERFIRYSVNDGWPMIDTGYNIECLEDFNKIQRIGAIVTDQDLRYFQANEMLSILEGKSFSLNDLVEVIVDSGGVDEFYPTLVSRYKALEKRE